MRETRRSADRAGRGRAHAPPDRRRHRPYRRHPGPGRAGADARRRAQGCARLRASTASSARSSAPPKPRPSRPPKRAAEKLIHVKLDDGAIVAARRNAPAPRRHRSLRRPDRRRCRRSGASRAARSLRRHPGGTSCRRPLTLAARARIEKEPNYTYVSARLLLDAHAPRGAQVPRPAAVAPHLRGNEGPLPRILPRVHRSAPPSSSWSTPSWRTTTSSVWARRCCPSATCKFDYLGLQTLYDRYFIHSNKVRFELPQAFFMRVAMGLAIERSRPRSPRHRVLQPAVVSFDFMSSTPTLFNSGTLRPQLSSCYLTTVPDDLRRHLRRDPRQRHAVASLPAAWATTGRRCAAWAPTSRAPTASPTASCRS